MSFRSVNPSVAYCLKIRWVVGATLILLTFTGCRLPKLFINPELPVIKYDTAFEQDLIGLPPPAPDSIEYDARWRYRDTLAEPVTLLNYAHGSESTWEILFATNRVPQRSERPGEVRFSGNYSQGMTYGATTVQLRIPDPEELQANKPQGFWGKAFKYLPRSWQEEILIDERQLSSLERVTPQQQEQFYTNLRTKLAASREQDLLIFVHGFNVDFESAVSRATQIARDMPFNGAVIAYSWPSQGGVENYQRDGEIIEDSLDSFSTFLIDLQREIPPGTRVNLIVHSMGNRLVMRALSRLELPQNRESPFFENIVLCAPDVGVEDFKRMGRQVVKHAHRTTLYRCLNDTALIASAYKNGEERAGGSLAPVILEGLETIECSVIDTSILGHSYYGSNPHMLRDLFCLIKERQGAEQRAWLTRKSIPYQGHYWIVGSWPPQMEWVWHVSPATATIQQVQHTEPHLSR